MKSLLENTQFENTMRIILFFFLISTTCVFSQDTFYVSTQGDDTTNSGTETSPFLTINKALTSMTASGGTCIIKG